MEKAFILHMFTPEKNLSPFDVNMAVDAGWGSTTPYTHLETGDIQALVQDAIFSRGPVGVKRTGIFIGGRDVKTAIDMLDVAKKSMVPPFEISVFADPSGAFTTAAAMVALVENELIKYGLALENANVLCLGGTGPVGQIAAVLAAQSGANVKIIGRQLEKAQAIAELCNTEYGGGKTKIEGAADATKGDLILTADVVMATAAAGIQVLSAELVAAAPKLKVAADVNAVPPSGIAGLDPFNKGSVIKGSNSGAVGLGALAIGNLKYKTQNNLLTIMRYQTRKTDSPVYLHYEHAFAAARILIGKKP